MFFYASINREYKYDKFICIYVYIYIHIICTFAGSGNAHNAGQHGAAQEGAQNQLVPRVDPRASKASLLCRQPNVVQ